IMQRAMVPDRAAIRDAFSEIARCLTQKYHDWRGPWMDLELKYAGREAMKRPISMIRARISRALQEKYGVVLSGKQLIYDFDVTWGFKLAVLGAAAMTGPVFIKFLQDGYGFLLTALRIQRSYEKHEWLLTEEISRDLIECAYLTLDDHKGNLKTNFPLLF